MNQKRFYIKKLIFKLMSCVMISFLVITASIMPKKENYVIHADTDVKINPFVWLCSYFGINIYTDAQEINDAFYDGISLAWATWQASLENNQSNKNISIQDIIGNISWDSQQPKMVKISGWVFNAMRAFADYLDSKVTTASEALEIGTFEIEGQGSYYLPSLRQNVYYAKSGNYYYGLTYTANTSEVRAIIVRDSSSKYRMFFVSLNNFSAFQWSNTSSNPNYSSVNGSTTSRSSDQGNYYYAWWGGINATQAQLLNDFNIPIVDGGNTDADRIAYRYTFGSNVIPGDPTLNDIYALPNQATLDDLIGSADPDSDVSLDIEDSDIPWSTAATLQDILDSINELTDSYVLDDSYPETLGKVIAQAIPIVNELPDVTYPNAPTWDVPEPIGTPVITPLLVPECPTLSACLVAGIEEVGTTMSNVIESNSNINNYVSVVLFMGLSLLILGGI